MIWNDVNLFRRDYTNGIKKLNGVTDDYKDLQNAKLKHSSKAFDITPDIDEHGLEDRYTIRPFKLHYDNSLKDLFKNKCTPSSVLNGKVNLSTGTKEIIKMTNKLIPKIDHSTIDPGYYEYKLNDVKSNKDLMMKRLSNADAFAKSLVKDLKKGKEEKVQEINAFGDDFKENKTIRGDEFRELRRKRNGDAGYAGELTDIYTSHETLASPPPERFDEKTKRNKRLLTGKGLNISPIKKSNESLLESKFINDWEEMGDELDNITNEGNKMDELRKKRGERVHKFDEMVGKVSKNDKQSKLLTGAEETKQRREIIKNDASNKIKKFISNVAKQKKANKGKARYETISESVADYLEESDDDETEAEPKGEEPKSGGKKKKQSKDEKEESFNKHISSLTHEMLDAGIKSIDKEIEDYKDVNKKHVILKETSEDLNKRFGLYGLKFKTGTLVSSVLKKLSDHKMRLEGQNGIRQVQSKLIDLKSEGKKEDSKKVESI